MAENFVARQPDYQGDGIAVWVSKDRNGKTYLNVKVLGHTVACFKNESKQSTEARKPLAPQL